MSTLRLPCVANASFCKSSSGMAFREGVAGTPFVWQFGLIDHDLTAMQQREPRETRCGWHVNSVPIRPLLLIR